MNADELRKYCLAFPDATENLQWQDDLCFKIRGKIFAIVSLDNPRLCFKCDPETFARLVELENVRPAPYVGRYKWVMLDRLDALHHAELRELIRESYEMVEARAPKTTKRRSAKVIRSAKPRKKVPRPKKR